MNIFANSLTVDTLTRKHPSPLVAVSGCACERSRDVTRGQGRHNFPGAESLWGRQITAGGAE